MSEKCKWLHECLDELPIIRYPFELEQLPKNGIYFFYENGEKWKHAGISSRIVRVGTHKQGNFRSRIKEHYLLDDSKMNFNKYKPKPSDRSIFRKNIGRAILGKNRDSYLKIWDIDFTNRKKREYFGHLRNIQKEIETEFNITRIMKDNFSFRFLIMEDQHARIGNQGIESSLIGTIAGCSLCKASDNWLGKNSPIKKINESRLWQVQHLKSFGLDDDNRNTVLKAIVNTKEWLKTCE